MRACVRQQLLGNPPPATPSRLQDPQPAQGMVSFHEVRFPISLSSEDCWPASGWSTAKSPCENSSLVDP